MTEIPSYAREITSDAIVFLTFIGAAFLLMLAVNKDRVFNVPASIYMSVAITSALPIPSGSYLPAAAFLVIFLIGVVFLNAEGFFRVLQRAGVADRLWHKILWGTASSGMLLSALAGFVPDSTVVRSFFLSDVFQSDIGRATWFILPLVILFFLRKSRDFRSS